MKALTTLALTLAVTSGALSTHVSPQTHQGVDICKAEIQSLYGDDTELALVDMRRDRSGTHMRVAARLEADNSRFVSCWLPRQEGGGGVYNHDSTSLASTSVRLVEH